MVGGRINNAFPTTICLISVGLTLVNPAFSEQGRVNKVLPDISRTQQQSLQSKSNFRVKRITVVGSDALPDVEISQTVREYENRVISVDELQELRHQLSQQYLKAGYINSGVIIPDQNVSNGNVKLNVVAGKLGTVEIDGNTKLKDQYIEARIRSNTDSALKLNDLQYAIKKLEQDPLIQRVNARLSPGMSLGDSRLRILIKEKQPFHLRVAANNHRSPSVSGEQLVVEGGHKNITGNGDSLDATIAVTDGLAHGSIIYSFPISARDTLFSARVGHSNASLVEEPFTGLVESETNTVGISLSQPFQPVLNKSELKWNGTFSIEHKKSETLFKDSEFIIDKSEASIIAANMSFLLPSSDTVTAFSAGARTTFNAKNEAFDSEVYQFFYVVTLQGQFAKKFTWHQSQLVVQVLTQQTSDSVLSSEKIAVGGRSSVRGYRENQFVRDNAILASIEYKLPLFVDSNNKPRFGLQLAPFVDMGRSWNYNENDKAELIKSVGIGLLYNPLKGLGAELFYGRALDEVNTDGDIQDHGFHFQLAYQVPL